MIGLNKKKNNFYASMYLECVCDTEREEFFGTNTDSKLADFRKAIKDDSYDVLLNAFVEMMHAKMAILFQERKRRPLSQASNGRSITVLSRSTESYTERIGILRSELLDFYRNYSPMDSSRPASTLLLDIKDSVRVVEVAEKQNDPMVCWYERTPCVISYIQLDYLDQLSSEKKHIYFAFFYEESKKDNLLELLEFIRCFLAFRFDLKKRIEKDFNGNMFGKQMETAWSNSWLSIEKAGAHTDSSEISRLVQEVEFKNSNIMNILFASPEKKMDGNVAEEKKRIFRFIYNINISMYYRAVISEGDSPFYSVDDIIKNPADDKTRYYRVEDAMHFSKSDDPKILYGTGENSDQKELTAINNAVLFGKKSNPVTTSKKYTGGIPRKKAITVRQRYLQAFLMDILHNIEKFGKKGSPARIYLELGKNAPGYLVFCNEVERNGEDLEHWCARENYRLKQAAEFDHAVDPNAQKGMSLGCIAHCMSDYGNMIVYYKHNGGNVFFEIKLPIIQSEGEE